MDMDEFLSIESVKFDKTSPKAQIKFGQETISGRDLPLIEQIDKLRELLQRQKFKEAGDLYLDVKKKFSQITRQHIEEKTFIHDELADINEKLTQTMNLQLDEMNKNKILIENVIFKAEALMQQKNLEEADALLKQVQEQVKKIPEMFAEQKLTLDNKIINLSSRLILERTKTKMIEFELKKKEIEIILDQGFNNINIGRLDLAKKIYIKVSKLYESLPEGFLYGKLQLYRKMLKIYHETELSLELRALQADEKTAQQIEQNTVDTPKIKQGFTSPSIVQSKIVSSKFPSAAPSPAGTNRLTTSAVSKIESTAEKSLKIPETKVSAMKMTAIKIPAMKMPPLPVKK